MYKKVVLAARNEAHMQEIIEKAIKLGLIRDVDFFCIRDGCLTELTPDETGTRWTCIGFRPLDNSVIDKITSQLPLYRD